MNVDLKYYKTLSRDELTKELVNSCINGNFEAVKYLLSSPELQKRPDIHAEKDYPFKMACQHGHLNIVQYLLTSPDLFSKIDISKNYYAFLVACEYGHLDIVRYLATSPELTQHVNVLDENFLAFQLACAKGQLEVVKYLTTSPDLKSYPDIHVDNDDCFKFACSNGHLNVLKFLIFELNIEKTEFIKAYLKHQPNDEVKSMFTLREINQQLKNELNQKNPNKKKAKL